MGAAISCRCAGSASGPPRNGCAELAIGAPPERSRAVTFVLQRSTLLALVMAFAGVEETRRLYALAVEQHYRFYSFGDAMLIL